MIKYANLNENNEVVGFTTDDEEFVGTRFPLSEDEYWDLKDTFDELPSEDVLIYDDEKKIFLSVGREIPSAEEVSQGDDLSELK